MELIVLIIKDKNKLHSVLFSCMFYSKAVLLTAVIKFLLNCNRFFYFLFSREQRPSPLAHKIWSYRTRSQLRYWWKNSFPGSSEYCKKVAYLYVLLLFFRLGTADLVPSTLASVSNTHFFVVVSLKGLFLEWTSVVVFQIKMLFAFLFLGSKTIQILLSSWVTVLKLISHISNLF